jgi:hypothetical protein
MGSVDTGTFESFRGKGSGLTSVVMTCKKIKDEKKNYLFTEKDLELLMEALSSFIENGDEDHPMARRINAIYKKACNAKK